jgi:AraC-like DNA-binding protein
MNQEAIRNAGRIETARQEIVEQMSRLLPEDGRINLFSDLLLIRSSVPAEPVQSLFQPSFCFVAQGRKRASVGGEVFLYDPFHYLIFTVDLPVAFQIEAPSKELPYLGLSLNLDSALVASVIVESGIQIKKGDASVKAMNVSAIDADLLDAVARLVRIAETPAERKVLAPLVIKEIIYRLLAGGQGARLAHLLTASDTRRISKAIGHLREHFDEQLKMEEIARELGMSVSGFHHHFKSVTSMSPLQFQKHLRLQEARRLMLGEDLDAASAGFRVGYEDPSYFNRDYKKQFGAPPQRDVTRLRNNLEA